MSANTYRYVLPFYRLSTCHSLWPNACSDMVLEGWIPVCVSEKQGKTLDRLLDLDSGTDTITENLTEKNIFSHLFLELALQQSCRSI